MKKRTKTIKNCLKKQCFIAIGCNILENTTSDGDIEQKLNSRYESIIAEIPFQIVNKSHIYKTPAFPKGSGPDYRNGVVEIATDLSASELLLALHRIENEFGRSRPYRWAPRSCDIDLLFYGNEILPDLETWQRWYGLSLEEAKHQTPDQLICPHPRLHDRAFVLGPMLDIAPEWHHPVLRLTMAELWQNLPREQKDEIHLVKAIDP